MEKKSADQKTSVVIDKTNRKATIVCNGNETKVESDHFRKALAAAVSNHGQWLAIATSKDEPYVVVYFLDESGTWEQSLHQMISFSEVELCWSETSEEGYPPEDLQVTYPKAPKSSGRFLPARIGWKWVRNK